ncbi:hypothetical protein bcere0026_53650 [Bacillus mycoides]|uniref:Uncharacterized protein n=1 Tax=Bacillus mycoides TaxID=1405 RepID=C2Y318_BACMY|nr:hypothetical protein bcere0026_53650 [Bacillus mycoides]
MYINNVTVIVRLNKGLKVALEYYDYIELGSVKYRIELPPLSLRLEEGDS